MKKNIVTTLLEHVKYFGLRKLYYMFLRSVVGTNDILIDIGLKDPQKQQVLTKHGIARTLIRVYGADGGHNIDPTTGFLGFGLIHYALVRNLKPRRVLCIGSRMGFIPAILALACKDNRRGQVDFVDAGYGHDNPEKHWSGIGFWKKTHPVAHFTKLGVSDRITTHVMTTREYANKYPKRRYQYIYVDGDHSYKGVKLDYFLFWPRLDKGGFMSFHDVVAKGHVDKGLFGVWKFWKELRGNKITLPFPRESGLGIVQKTNKL